ncbi:MAG: hypothetical protein L3J56_12655 [Bacteroidales bacterium]|nr:hypothetical protein [Bacteroidales bacterium]
MKKIPEKFKNYFWAENRIFFPDEEFIIKLSYPRVFIRYKLSDGYFADFDTFFENIAEIQYLDGKRPSEKEQKEILTDIWNYLSVEERLLEQNIDDIENEIDDLGLIL